MKGSLTTLTALQMTGAFSNRCGRTCEPPKGSFSLWGKEEVRRRETCTEYICNILIGFRRAEYIKALAKHA